MVSGSAGGGFWMWVWLGEVILVSMVEFNFVGLK